MQSVIAAPEGRQALRQNIFRPTTYYPGGFKKRSFSDEVTEEPVEERQLEERAVAEPRGDEPELERRDRVHDQTTHTLQKRGYDPFIGEVRMSGVFAPVHLCSYTNGRLQIVLLPYSFTPQGYAR